MRLRGLLVRTIGSGLILAFVLLPIMTGCTAMASKEQFGLLETARTAADKAEAELGSCQQRQANLERELANKKQELVDLRHARATVQGALSE